MSTHCNGLDVTVLYAYPFVRVCYCDVNTKVVVETLVGGCVEGELGKKGICDAELGFLQIEKIIKSIHAKTTNPKEHTEPKIIT